MFNEQKCRACGNLFFWAITVNKKRMPIDIEPNPLGNCEVSTGHGAPFVRVHKGPPGMLDDWTPFMPHFASCPNWFDAGHKPDNGDVATLKPCRKHALNEEGFAETCSLPLSHAGDCQPGQRLPDPVEKAAERASEGVARSAASAGDEWFKASLDVVYDYLTTHRTMTSDDLRAELPKRANNGSMKAVGAVISSAAANGWCSKAKPSGSFWPADAMVCVPSAQSNGSPKPLWVSNLNR